MGIIRKILILFSVGCSLSAYACELSESKVFPSMSVGNGAIVFAFVPIEKESGDSTVDERLGIDVSFFDCKNKSEKLIGQLPFFGGYSKS